MPINYKIAKNPFFENVHPRKKKFHDAHYASCSSMLTHISFLRKFLGTGIIQNGIHEFHEAMPFQY